MLFLATSHAQVEPEVGPFDEERIAEVFEDLLGREPSRRELREWRDRSDGLTIDEFRRELKRTREYRDLEPEDIVRRAYRDLLDREPDEEGMRNYRKRIVDRGWTAGRVREAIRESDEYKLREFDRIIDRAYDDLLERAADPEGREEYRRYLRRGGTEDGMRRRLRESEEFRFALPRRKITEAYRELLGREPDEKGLENYRRKMIRDGWSEERVRDAIRKSPEYKALQKKPSQK